MRPLLSSEPIIGSPSGLSSFRWTWLIVFASLSSPCDRALAWGQEGHSSVAEVAQRRLSPEAAAVARLLGPGTSLASVASWADDLGTSRPETGNWHFVDIPLASDGYDPAVACRDVPGKGDCVIAELARVDHDLRCDTDPGAAAEAPKLAVHLVGDVHQPLHTVAERRGGNDVPVDVLIGGLTCVPQHVRGNLHALWDGTLIQRTTFSWGAYGDRLEAGWLRTADPAAVVRGKPVDWALEAHRDARLVWREADGGPATVDDAYYRQVLPTLDRDLGEAGLRLARFLNEALAAGACEGH